MQFGSVYPDLDLSKIAFDDAVPMTPGGGHTLNEEFDDAAHIEE